MLDFEQKFVNDGALHIRPLARSNAEPDMEMGFLGLLAAAIPAVTGLVGSLVKRGKKAKPEVEKAQEVLNLLTNAVGADANKGETSIKDVVRNIVSTVPSPVVNQVKKAIAEMRNAEKAGLKTKVDLVNAVDAKFGPQVHAILAALKADQIRTQATYEHNKLRQKAQFRSNTTKGLKDISLRLARIEARLNKSAVVQGENRMNLFGGRAVLER